MARSAKTAAKKPAKQAKTTKPKTPTKADWDRLEYEMKLLELEQMKADIRKSNAYADDFESRIPQPKPKRRKTT